MKRFIFLCTIVCSLFSCAQSQKPAPQQVSGGIVPKPQSQEMRAGERMNMILLMGAEANAEEMDEVIVIPPSGKKQKTPQE